MSDAADTTGGSALDVLLAIDDQLDRLSDQLAQTTPRGSPEAAERARFEALRQKVKADIERVLDGQLDAAKVDLAAATARLQPLNARLGHALATTASVAGALDLVGQVMEVAATIAAHATAL